VFINPISDNPSDPTVPKRYIEPGLPRQFVLGATLTY